MTDLHEASRRPSKNSIAIRHYQPADLPALTRLFAKTIQHVNSADYSPRQVAIWVASADDVAAWRTRLAERDRVTLVAELGGQIVGFTELKTDGYLHMLYVHHRYQRRGIAAALLAHNEHVAHRHGISRLHTQASITARPFFEQAGFRMMAAQHVVHRGVRFRNFRMEKLLIDVRRCRQADWPAVLALLRQLWPDPRLNVAAIRAAYRRGLRSRTRVYLCAVAGRRIVGFGSFSMSQNLWQPGFSGGHVDELVVDDQHRGGGIGGQLLERLVATARRRGCRVLELESAGHRTRAHGFYERHGFQLRATKLFSRKL